MKLGMRVEGLAHDLGTGVGRNLRRLLHILRLQGGALQTWHLQLQVPFAWVKNPPAVQETRETQARSLGRGDPLEKEMATQSSILPEKPHRQRSLEGYSPWGHKELDKTEQACMQARYRKEKKKDEKDFAAILTVQPHEGQLPSATASCCSRCSNKGLLPGRVRKGFL